MIHKKKIEEILKKYEKRYNPYLPIEVDSEIFVIFLKDINVGPKSIMYRLGDVFKKKYTYEEVLDHLRYLNLNVQDIRNEVYEDANLLTKELKKLIFDETVDFKNVDEIINQIKSKKQKYQYYEFNVFKAVAILLFILDEKLNKLKSSQTVKQLKGINTKYLILDILKAIKETYKIENKSDDNEILDIIEDTLAESHDNKNIKDKDQLIHILEFELKTMKSNFLHIKKLFENQSSKLNQFAVKAKKDAIGDFFNQLNSDKHGNLLDKLIFMEKQLKKLRINGYVFPIEVASIPLIIRQIVKFIKDIGIKQIEEEGKEFEVTLKDIELMNYQGEPFIDENEKKKVKVLTSGWKYEDYIISIPTVKEID